MDNLETKIKNILSEKTNDIEAYKKIVLLCNFSLNSLRSKVKSKGFLNEKDEIVFFKKTKQVPLHNYLYYSELLRLTLETQGLTKKESKRFFRKNLNHYKKEISTNKEFANYIRLGETHYDRLYFVRREETRLTLNTISDPEFSTSHDFLMAKISSHFKLLEFIEEKTTKSKSTTREQKLKWTASKVSLIELIYALYHSKVINRGSTEIKEIAFLFESIFNIELGDYYRTYSEIKSRKSVRAKFLNDLAENLTNEISRSYDN